MTTSKNSNRKNNERPNLSRGGVTAMEGARPAQVIDYTHLEDSYELLPSGD
jgi:hypothetical protein